jgi:hypothetical protein
MPGQDGHDLVLMCGLVDDRREVTLVEDETVDSVSSPSPAGP